MGGAIEIVSSTIGLAQAVSRKNNQPPDRSGELKAEREAQEAEQRKEEADERRRERRQITEARERERRRRETENTKGKTLLTNGGVGYVDDPNLYVPKLKDKLGE